MERIILLIKKLKGARSEFPKMRPPRKGGERNMYINGPYGYGWYNPEIFDSNGHYRHGHGGHDKEHREEMT